MKPELLTTTPEPIAPDTWLIPTLAADPAGGYIGAHSAVIRGAEPVIVDTSVLFGREQWLRNVFSVVEPEDVRWIFLSHDDHDHLGNLDLVLELCPNATLLANYAMVGRLFGDVELPLERMRWINVGESIDVGDRELLMVRPPMFDSPATRGLFDTRTGMFWAADSFGSAFPGAVYDADDIPADVYDPSFELLNLLNTPWLEWVDPTRFADHVHTTESLPLTVVAERARPGPPGRPHRRRVPPHPRPRRAHTGPAARAGDPRAPLRDARDHRRLRRSRMGTIPRHASVDLVVDAPPTAVWEVVGDPRRTGEWSHECLEVAFVDGGTAPVVGVRFRGRNQVGRNGWTRTCEIVGLEPGREISWRTIPSPLHNDSTIWTISVEPGDAGGSRITQRYEVVKLGPLMDRFIYQFVPVHRDRREALTADLRRIGDVARGPEAGTTG